MKPPLEAFDEQLQYDRASRTFTARCGVCGKVISQKKVWFRTKAVALQKLRLNFGCCEKCGKWICEDCFCVDDGNGNSIGMCTKCARERGINGLTIEQFDVEWPAIQSRILAWRKAAVRVINNERLSINN